MDFSLTIQPRFRTPNVLQYHPDVHINGAVFNTPATADAACFVKVVNEIFELVHHPVAVTFFVAGAGVVPGTMQREQREGTGIPVTDPAARAVHCVVHDVKAVAGGA